MGKWNCFEQGHTIEYKRAVRKGQGVLNIVCRLCSCRGDKRDRVKTIDVAQNKELHEC